MRRFVRFGAKGYWNVYRFYLKGPKPGYDKQVHIHKLSRDMSDLCPPCHSDTPLAASGSVSRIFDRPKKRITDGQTDGWTDGRTDGRMAGQTDGRKQPLIES